MRFLRRCGRGTWLDCPPTATSAAETEATPTDPTGTIAATGAVTAATDGTATVATTAGTNLLLAGPHAGCPLLLVLLAAKAMHWQLRLRPVPHVRWWEHGSGAPRSHQPAVRREIGA